jgi:hypothetical protein
MNVTLKASAEPSLWRGTKLARLVLTPSLGRVPATTSEFLPFELQCGYLVRSTVRDQVDGLKAQVVRQNGEREQAQG